MQLPDGSATIRRFEIRVRAEFARQYVYPTPQGNEGGEHVSAPHFLAKPELSLAVGSDEARVSGS